MADSRAPLVRQFLWLLFNSPLFLREFADRMEPEFFVSNEARYLAALALDCWRDHEELLPESVFNDIVEDDIKNERMEERGVSVKGLDKLLEMLTPVSADDEHYVWGEAAVFCRRQTLGIALNEALETLDAEGPDEAMAVIERARVQIEPPVERTASPFKDTAVIMERMELKREGHISTGLPKLDRVLGGGTLPGEMAAFIAPTGRGKTQWLCSVAGRAYLGGAQVIYYTLEVDRDEISLRILSCISGAPINELKINAHQTDKRLRNLRTVVRRVGQDEDDLQVVDLSVASVNTIRADIERRPKTARPRLVIIDYADRLQASTRYEKKTDNEYEVFKDLAALCKQDNFSLWTAIQGNRQSLGKAKLDLQQIAGAYAKAWEADFVVAAGQSDSMRRQSRFSLGMAKLRRVSEGAAGNQLAVFYDFSKASFRDWVTYDDELTSSPLVHVGALDDDDDDD